MTDDLRPCPNLACRSMNVEAAYLRTPGGSDPGCLDCSITAPIETWTKAVAAAKAVTEEK